MNLDILCLPCTMFNDFGLINAIDCLGHCVVIAIPTLPTRGLFWLALSARVFDGEILHAAVMMNELIRLLIARSQCSSARLKNPLALGEDDTFHPTM